jgi:RNA polymerase sigma-70 factor (ECF subfamily)
MINHLSDEQLMVHLAQGSKQAAAVLYDRYQAKLYGYFVRMTRDQDSSRDLTQNTFLKVIRYASSWKDDKVFAYWLFRIARNILVDHYRGAKRFYDLDEQPELAAKDNNDSVRESEARESYELLREAMSQLPPGYRELIEMNRFQGFSYREIAVTIDSNENAVKVKTFRAIQKLKEIYEKIMVE